MFGVVMSTHHLAMIDTYFIGEGLLAPLFRSSVDDGFAGAEVAVVEIVWRRSAVLSFLGLGMNCICICMGRDRGR